MKAQREDVEAAEVLAEGVGGHQASEVRGRALRRPEVQVDLRELAVEVQTEPDQPGPGAPGGGPGHPGEDGTVAPQGQRVGEQQARLGEVALSARLVGAADQAVAEQQVHVVRAGVQDEAVGKRPEHSPAEDTAQPCGGGVQDLRGVARLLLCAPHALLKFAERHRAAVLEQQHGQHGAFVRAQIGGPAVQFDTEAAEHPVEAPCVRRFGPAREFRVEEQVPAAQLFLRGGGHQQVEDVRVRRPQLRRQRAEVVRLHGNGRPRGSPRQHQQHLAQRPQILRPPRRARGPAGFGEGEPHRSVGQQHHPGHVEPAVGQAHGVHRGEGPCELGADRH